MLEHEEKYAVILAFDVKVRRRSNLIYGQDPDEGQHHA